LECTSETKRESCFSFPLGGGGGGDYGILDRNFGQTNSEADYLVRLPPHLSAPGALLHSATKKSKINAGGREGVGRFTGLPLWTGWVGREAICLLFFPLLLQLAFVFPGIAVGTQRSTQRHLGGWRL
jgi:hypothetical protein